MQSDSILESFERLVARSDGAPLVASPGRWASVGEVDRLARAITSDLLVVAGLEPGTLVALAAANGVAFLAAFVALRRARLVPLLMDAGGPVEERRRIARALGSAWSLTILRRFPDGLGDVHLEPTPTGSEPVRLPPDTAAVKLTSGSTGAPRGIVTPTEALAADEAALAATMGIDGDDRILAAIPLSHSYGLSSIAMAALVRGALMVLPEEASGPYGALTAARGLEATVFPTVPSYLDGLLRRAHPPRLAESVRLTLTAGAPLGPDTARRFRATWGRPVHVFYGSSETGGITFDREGTAGERGTVGEPVEGVRVELVPLGSSDGDCAGVVTVTSSAVAASYLPAAPGDRLVDGRFASGDLARWEGGELVLAGRTDDLINVRGKKVNPREVEAVLRELPGVREVAALAAAPGATGVTAAGDDRVRVVVACEAGAVSSEQVVAWCRERLAEHKVPRRVVLVEELPRTARGKIDRAALCCLGERRRGQSVGC